MASERVMIFIDASNLYHSAKSRVDPGKIDYRKLVDFLTQGRSLVRAYFYKVPVKQEQQFLRSLRHVPYFEVKLVGRLKHTDHGRMEKGVDVALAVDMVTFAAKNQYDTAILVSGDGDFAPAVQAVKDFGRHVEIAYVPDAISHQLLETADILRRLGRKRLKSVCGDD